MPVNSEKREPINLISGYEPEPRLLCGACPDAAILLPYPQLKLQNPYAGDGYICPRCGTVTDSSYTLIQREVTIEPVDVGNNSEALTIVPESKSSEIRFTRTNDDVIDPEPNEEAMIRQMGGTIIDKKLDVKRDY